MKIFILTSFFVLNSYAGITPGLWSTENSVKIDGQELDIEKKMNQAMMMIPEAQREQFKKMLAKQMGDSGLMASMTNKTLCVTKEMVKDPLSFVKKDKECKSTVVKDEPKEKLFKIKCENGAHGTMSWNIPNAKTYDGKFVGKSEKGENVEILFSGKFKAEKCPEAT